MFPFRRNGPKKRGKGGGGGGGGGRRHHDNGGGAGRRVPGSAAELLPMMQPSTKALAQMLAGNTKMSGQLAHARSVLAQANRMVEDRLPDRLPPAAREQFLEQLALLKLTITDAEEAGSWPRRRGREPAAPSRPRRWMPTGCATWRCAWRPPSRRRPGPLAPAARRRDRRTCPGRQVTSGYALSPARQAAEEQTAGRRRPAPARGASGCASSRCKRSRARAPTTDRAPGLAQHRRVMAADRDRTGAGRDRAANWHLSGRAIALCSSAAACWWNQATWDERQADLPERHAEGRSRHQDRGRRRSGPRSTRCCC